RENGGGVAEERIARAEELRQIGKGVVRDGVRRAIDDEETRLVAARGGRLRDEVRREFGVEESSGQRRHREIPAQARARGEDFLHWPGAGFLVGKQERL